MSTRREVYDALKEAGTSEEKDVAAGGMHADRSLRSRSTRGAIICGGNRAAHRR